MHHPRFLFDQRPDHRNWPLAAGKEFTTGEAQHLIFIVATDHGVELFFAERKDDAPYLAPVDRTGTHGAGFGAGVERAVDQGVRWKGSRCFAH